MSDYRPLVMVYSGGRANPTRLPVADAVEVGTGLISSGVANLTLRSGGSNIYLQGGKTLAYAAAGAGDVDFSTQSGDFKTTTGDVTIGSGASTVAIDGTVTVSGATNFTAVGTAVDIDNDLNVDGTATVTGTIYNAGGIERPVGVAGAMTIGSGAATTSIDIGSVGVLTTIKGDLQIDGIETVVGGTTFTGDVGFDGHVRIGTAPYDGDTVTFNARTATDLWFLREVDHDIGIDASTTLSAPGNDLTVRGAAGAPGSGATPGAAGGEVAVDAGAGGAGTALAAAGVGASLRLAGGEAGANNGGGGNDGGDVYLLGGAATGAGTDGSLNLGTSETSAVKIGAAAIPTDVDSNLDANLGLDVSGAAFTFTGTLGSWTMALADSALTQTGGGEVTITGLVNATAGIGVTGGSGLTIDGAGIDVATSALVLGTGTTFAPQMAQLTTAQRDALTPSNGMIIYNTSTGQLETYDGAWAAIGGSVTGTDSPTFTINQDATATESVDDALYMRAGRGAGGTTIQAWRLFFDHDASGAAGAYEGDLLVGYTNDVTGAYTDHLQIQPDVARVDLFNLDAGTGAGGPTLGFGVSCNVGAIPAGNRVAGMGVIMARSGGLGAGASVACIAAAPAENAADDGTAAIGAFVAGAVLNPGAGSATIGAFVVPDASGYDAAVVVPDDLPIVFGATGDADIMWTNALSAFQIHTTGALLLSGHAASSFTTSAGLLTLDGFTGVDLACNTTNALEIRAASINPGTDNTLSLGAANRRFTEADALQFQVHASSGDANPTSRLASGALWFGAGGASALDVSLARSAANTLQLASGDSFSIAGGALTQTGGQISLTGSGVDSIIRTIGTALNFTGGASSNWSSVGTLSIWGNTATNLGVNGSLFLGFTTGATDDIKVANGVTLGVDVGGMIDLPALFEIAGDAVGATVTADNLDTLTDGSNADALHVHASAGSAANLVKSGLTTTGLGTGDFGYISAALTMSKTDADAEDSSRCFGANEGTAGSMTFAGCINTAKFTTAGGSPANGAPVYLAPGTEEVGAAGKLTATAPSTAGQWVAEIGLCLDNSNWVALKTCVVALQPKAIIAA